MLRCPQLLVPDPLLVGAGAGIVGVLLTALLLVGSQEILAVARERGVDDIPAGGDQVGGLFGGAIGIRSEGWAGQAGIFGRRLWESVVLAQSHNDSPLG
jgi:hypothetical protein